MRKKVAGFVKKSLENRKVRFLFVGVLNTVVGYGTYALFIYLKMHYILAMIFSSIISVTHSYLWNKHFTFKSTDKSFAEAIRFVMVYAVGILLNMVLLYVCITLCRINAYAAGATTLLITTVISYIGHKKISFRSAKG
jgi:putative flippase GtrA